MEKDTILNTLEKVGLSVAEATVYVALLQGAVSAAEVIKMTGEKRPTVYYALGSLEKRGLVTKAGSETRKQFKVEPLEKLEDIVRRTIRQQEALLDKTEEIRKAFKSEAKPGKVLVTYFDNLKAIQSAIFYTLYTKDKVIRSIVPGNHFLLEVGLPFIEEYVTEKKKRGIKTIALWEDIPKKSVLEKFYDDSLVRQLPLPMHNSFETTIFMYDNKTLYISPKKEMYAFLVESTAHTKMMRTMFEQIWSQGITPKL